MKKIIAISLLGLSFGAMAEGVDYKHCQTAFNSPSFAPDKTFPFVLGDDGKVKAHKDVKYKFDSKTKTETMTFKGLGYGGPGTGNPQEVIIKRDEKGNITQVIYNSKNPGMKTRTGLGSKNPYGAQGFGYPGVGIGFPGGGGFGGYGIAGPTKMSTVFDVKVKDGKCFPYRNVGLFESAGNTHKTFNGDVQLCYDITKKLKEEGTDGSKASKLKQCYDDYQKEASKILSSHLKRNDDLYNPKDADEIQSPWGSGGYFGNLEESEFSDGTAAPAGGGGYGYAGGFAGSIDNIVQNQMFNPAQKLKMLEAYCSFPYGGMAEMLKDEGLFKEEPKTGGEGSGGGTAKKVQKK